MTAKGTRRDFMALNLSFRDCVCQPKVVRMKDDSPAARASSMGQSRNHPLELPAHRRVVLPNPHLPQHPPPRRSLLRSLQRRRIALLCQSALKHASAKVSRNRFRCKKTPLLTLQRFNVAKGHTSSGKSRPGKSRPDTQCVACVPCGEACPNRARSQYVGDSCCDLTPKPPATVDYI